MGTPQIPPAVALRNPPKYSVGVTEGETGRISSAFDWLVGGGRLVVNIMMN